MPAYSRRLTGLFLCMLAIPSCGIESFGGQSGDDGDAHPGGAPTPSPPEVPVPEGCHDETVPLDASTPTAFEYTPSELVARLAPPDSPFHWVDYSSNSFDARHSPGPSQSALSLRLEVRPPQKPEYDVVQQVSGRPSEGSQNTCDYVRVNVPVWVTLSTIDGALDARAPGHVTFYGPNVAELRARVSPTEMHGSFAIERVTSKQEAYTWELSALTVFAHLWDGGSAGILSPEFTARSLSTSSNGGADIASPPPSTEPVTSATHSISVPDRWEAVGVWPRLEQCAPGVVRNVNDRVLGVSVQDVLQELGEYSSFPLTVEADVTSSELRAMDAQLSAPAPSGLICVDVALWNNQMNFRVPATVTNTAAPPNRNARLLLNVETHANPLPTSTEISRIRFERVVDEVAQSVPWDQVEVATGLPVGEAPDEYSQFWWTWFGDVSPKTDRRRATFLVTSPNLEQTAAIETQVAEGGPGFGVGQDESGQSLPGDPIFKATSVP